MPEGNKSRVSGVGVGISFADLKRLSMRETAVSFVPEIDFLLAADPTKKDFPALPLCWEIDQAAVHVPDDYAFVEYLLNAVF